MIKKIRQLASSKFVRNVMIVAGGTAGAQAIALALMPIITRLYGPEAFGVLGTFSALLAIMMPVAALSYPIAIVLPKQDDDAKGLVWVSIKLGLASSILVSLVLLFLESSIVSLLNLGEAGRFLWFVPIAMFFSVLLATATQWAVRKKLFKLKAKVLVINALVQNTLKVAIGFMWPSAWVLITVDTFVKGLNALLLYCGIHTRREGRKEDFKRAAEIYSPTDKRLIKEYRDFAYFRTPQILLNAASQGMPVLMLSTMFGPVIAGYYALGKTALAAPTALLGQSVSTVFYPHFNEAIQAGRSGVNLLVKATISLSLVGAWPFLGVFIFGPELFEFVFGEEWKAAGEFARWLALWTFVGFINRPSVAAIPVLKLQGFFLTYEVVSTVLRAVALYFGYAVFGTALASVISFSLISMMLNGCLISYTMFNAGGGNR